MGPRRESQLQRRAAFGALFALLATLVGRTLIESPKHPQTAHFGDDSEYLLTTESFVRHHSADYQSEDALSVLANLPPRWRWAIARKYRGPAPMGYFADRDGRYYCWHFWTYGAAVAPIKRLLAARGLGAQAFGYANCWLFCAALFALLQLWRSPRVWLVIVPLAFLNPILWFLPFAHTEPFVFALGLAAVSCLLRRRYLSALLLNSLAATQFQPLALVSLLYAGEALASRLRWRWLWGSFKASWKYCVACLACATINLAPALFYRHHFGVTSLIAREGFAASRFMSLDKFLSMLIDLNDGMITYMPGLLWLLICSAVLALRRAVTARTLGHLLPWLAVLAVLWSATSALGWNYQTLGVSRYALYAAPPMLLLVANEVRALARFNVWIQLCVAVAFGLQLWVHATFGWFAYRGHNNLHHNIVADYVLQRWPRFYNPPPEMFCARTLRARCFLDRDTGLVQEQHLPVVFISDLGKPVKALAVTCDPERLLRAADWSEEQRAVIRARLAPCPERVPVYVDF
jgi:hypothetical protein